MKDGRHLKTREVIPFIAYRKSKKWRYVIEAVQTSGPHLDLPLSCPNAVDE